MRFRWVNYINPDGSRDRRLQHTLERGPVVTERACYHQLQLWIDVPEVFIQLKQKEAPDDRSKG